MLVLSKNAKKTFKRLDALENHVRSQHTGEAPLICPHPHCGLHFTTNAKLRYHVVLHSGDRPYKCSIPGCERTFVTHSQLKQHEKSVLVHKKLKIMVGQKDLDLTRHFSSPVPTVHLGSEFEDMSTDDNLLKKLKLEGKAISEGNSQLIGDMGFNAMMTGTSKVQNLLFEDLLDNNYSKPNKEKLLERVLDENEALKDRLETSEKLLGAMKEQMDRISFLLPQEFQRVMPPQQCPNFLFKKPEFQEMPNFSLTKDVDSYFFENPCTKLEFFSSDDHHTRAETSEERFSDKGEDLFTNFNFEDFPSLL